ncbi:HAMP domain-containing protein [Sphingomonas lacunae]|uniref:histidine kinase n=1 Tax=Sphingomonas lacunae TaxID=2698828 RepID=A0A6M4AVX2_9SPHN|nr:ATP-binding protein [Sphingomonas lacunae]QJQ33245.1 HAMP domain-containing protein [Sphingomonas lacunae]
MPRIGPRSLAGQLMLVTAIALMLAQAINLALLVQSQRHERVAAIAAGAAAQIGEARERLELGVPVDRRGGFRRDRRDDDGRRGRDRIDDDDDDDRRPEDMRRRRVLIDDVPRFRPEMNEWPELAYRVSRHLADNGVAVQDVRAAHMDAPAPIAAMMARPRGAQIVAVAARLDDGRWITIRARLPGAAPWLGNMLLVQTLILFALLLGPLLFVAWRVSRPLSRLAQAASDTRPGVEAEAVRESGPEDVRALTRAFNAMRRRIHAMLSEKDHMLGAIGHDLRTPLASLRVRVEQVEDEALRDRMAATITDMAAMLDDILSLARAGQPVEQPEPTDLAAMIGAIAEDYQAMGRPVTLAAEGALVSRRIRPSSMRRAIRNLVDNAVTYGGSAELGLSRGSDGSVTISVDDKGPGIPAHRMADMLEPFARMEQSRNRNTGGSGLGLTLARAIAQAEGGTLTLGNRPTGGLSARITLPPEG